MNMAITYTKGSKTHTHTHKKQMSLLLKDEENAKMFLNFLVIK